eukprot:4882891-Pyramimonas_sp.AAC.1
MGRGILGSTSRAKPGVAVRHEQNLASRFGTPGPMIVTSILCCYLRCSSGQRHSVDPRNKEPLSLVGLFLWSM